MQSSVPHAMKLLRAMSARAMTNMKQLLNVDCVSPIFEKLALELVAKTNYWKDFDMRARPTRASGPRVSFNMERAPGKLARAFE